MGFKNHNEKIRSCGRYMVLPVRKIEKYLNLYLFNKKSYEVCVDFGAGTLFWSKRFFKKVKKVFAIDLIYDAVFQNNEIICSHDLAGVRDEYINTKKKMIWICDVLHHLNVETESSLLRECYQEFDAIIIKDIDCNRSGNVCNKIHDRIINGEKVRDIDPRQLKRLLEDNGYAVKQIDMRRLWYPHFLLIASREG